MKKTCTVPGIFNSFVSALGIVLTAASPAFANNGPGPLAAVSVLSLVLLIVVLTFAGGGYGVVKRLDDAKYPSKIKRTIRNTLEFLAGVVLFFVGIMTTVFGVVGFSVYAIARGVKLIQWSRAAGKDGARPAHLEGANPKRLKAAGSILIVLTLLIFGYSMLHLDEVIGIAPYEARGHASMLNSEVKIAYSYALIYLEENPKAKVVTCADMEKAGYKPPSTISCFSDMTATSGGIRMTGPERWKLQKPAAFMTYSGEFTPAEP
jgi:hypothetical protein